LGFINFIIKSYVFRWFALLTILLVVIIYFSNKLYDSLWKKTSAIPLLDLNIVYKPPKQYDDFNRLNLILLNKTDFAIESNKKFKIEGTQKKFDYCDTTRLNYPDQSFDYVNKVYLKFENSAGIDSIFLVISKSTNQGLFWNQIFYSSVYIERLNTFSDNLSEFRINENALVEQSLLDNNDTLISKVLNYFEANKLFASDCGINCITFTDVCSKFNLPCRPIGLQGGDAYEEGFNDILGYPLHAICEVYSSKHKKWYVIDPTYGIRFKNSGSEDFLNAVEISNMVYFNRDKFIIQDSILTTMRSMVGRDYFKYYENIYYRIDFELKQPLKKIMLVLYKKFIYNHYHFANNLNPVKNGYYYVILKTVVYIFIAVLYFNAVLLVITRRLLAVKKPKG